MTDRLREVIRARMRMQRAITRIILQGLKEQNRWRAESKR
jgi:hypothetical protein